MSLDKTLLRPGAPDIQYRVHPPSGAIKGAVLLTHGFAEHSGRYGEVIAQLNERGLLVATYDLRGHGRSGGLRGYIDSFDEYLGDADALLGELSKDAAWQGAGLPLLMGHSLGGLISFHVALRDPGRFRALLLSSPFFGVSMPVPLVKRLAGRLLSKIAPRVSLPSGLHGSDLTHDAARARAYDADPMLIPGARARFYTEFTRAQALAVEQAPSFSLPLLMLVAGDDRVVSVAATRVIFERVSSRAKEMEVFEGQFHELFNEVARARFIGLAADGAARLLAPALRPAGGRVP